MLNELQDPMITEDVSQRIQACIIQMWGMFTLLGKCLWFQCSSLSWSPCSTKVRKTHLTRHYLWDHLHKKHAIQISTLLNELESINLSSQVSSFAKCLAKVGIVKKRKSKPVDFGSVWQTTNSSCLTPLLLFQWAYKLSASPCPQEKSWEKLGVAYFNNVWLKLGVLLCLACELSHNNTPGKPNTQTNAIRFTVCILSPVYGFKAL